MTDCRAFEATMRKKDLCVRVGRYYSKSSITKSSIVQGKICVDALSCNPVSECNVIEKQESGIMAQLAKA